MDAIEKEARRAFALTINIHNYALRPDAEKVEFNFVTGHRYELRMSVEGQTFAGQYDSTHENADLWVEIELVEVIASDGTKSYPNLKCTPFKSELGDNYADAYD